MLVQEQYKLNEHLQLDRLGLGSQHGREEAAEFAHLVHVALAQVDEMTAGFLRRLALRHCHFHESLHSSSPTEKP